MDASVTKVRRGLFGMLAGGLLAFGTAAIIFPVATAESVPGRATAGCSPDAAVSVVTGTMEECRPLR